MTKNNFNVGDRVYFGSRNGQKTLGEIIKKNPKRAKVKTLEIRGTRAVAREGEVWNVTYSALTPATEGRPNRITHTRPVRPVPTTSAELLVELQGIEAALSPENLHCDGEISRSAAQRKARSLNARRRVLVKALGREPTNNELWGV